MQSIPQIEFEAQGRLVKLKVKLPKLTQFASKKNHRGKVSVFSKASRKRLLELMARLDLAAAALGKPIIFITLTYAQKWPASTNEAKNHLRALLERLRRFAPQSSGVWRIEYQERGAPHFHLLLFNLPYLPKETLAAAWGEIIGRDYWDYSQDEQNPRSPFTKIESIKSGRRAVAYVSKYVAKLPETAPARFEEDAVGGGAEGAASGFNTIAYLHAGRWWGVFNADFLPYAEAIKMSLSMETAGEKRVFFDYRRLMAAKFAGVRRRQSLKGASLFVDSSDKWIDYWLHLWLEHCSLPS